MMILNYKNQYRKHGQYLVKIGHLQKLINQIKAPIET